MLGGGQTLVAAPLVWALRPAPESSAPVSTSSNRVLSARLCASITPTLSNLAHCVSTRSRPHPGSLVDLIRRIQDGQGEFLLFALTPPRLATDRERVQEIADTTVARLRPLDLDGLILYDIDDESERNPAERPFPFMPTMDPADYLADHLGAWRTPVIVYRAVSKYTPTELRAWLSAQDPARVMTVLVGAPSSTTTARTSLADAQELRREVNPALTLGGVAIPERHSRREDEHLRLLSKQEAGCRFFVTQVVYDLNAARNLVSDYHYECRSR